VTGISVAGLALLACACVSGVYVYRHRQRKVGAVEGGCTPTCLSSYVHSSASKVKAVSPTEQSEPSPARSVQQEVGYQYSENYHTPSGLARKSPSLHTDGMLTPQPSDTGRSDELFSSAESCTSAESCRSAGFRESPTAGVARPSRRLPPLPPEHRRGPGLLDPVSSTWPTKAGPVAKRQLLLPPPSRCPPFAPGSTYMALPPLRHSSSPTPVGPPSYTRQLPSSGVPSPLQRLNFDDYATPPGPRQMSPSRSSPMLGRSSPALEIARTGIGIAKVGIGMARVDDKLTPGEAEKLAMILSGTEEALHEVAASSAPHRTDMCTSPSGVLCSPAPQTPQQPIRRSLGHSPTSPACSCAMTSPRRRPRHLVPGS